MNKNDYGIEVRAVANGYVLKLYGCETEVGVEERVIQHDDQDPLWSAEELLFQVAEHFGLLGSKHDEERITIVRQKTSSDD